VSGGRAVFGVGRGDSALAHIGLAPASPATFEHFLVRLQAYLRGEAVEFEPVGDARAIDTIPGAGHPPNSQLLWLDPHLPKVPVDVAATGPKVIALAARQAERLMFSVGADTERLHASITHAREARAAAGLDPADLSFGAYINVVAHPDRDIARDLAATGVATFSRFSVMHGRPAAAVSAEATAVLERLSDSYDLREHGSGTAHHRAAVTAEYIDHFAIAGPPAECVVRLQELQAVGLDRVAILRAMSEQSDELTRSERLFAAEVLPAFRS
jgi:5,10-methylenetetrahydromethanopterin reductase